MASKLAINLKPVDTYNDLFTPSNDIEETKTGITEIDVNLLKEYPNHPFKMYNEDKLLELALSIEENGLLNPIIVQKKGTDYFILAGHNRTEACKLLRFKKVPTILKEDLTEEEADLIVVETNLRQREELLASEKARAYKMQNDAIKKQGTRSDLTYCQVGNKLKTSESLSKQFGENKRNIHRYIRLNNLIFELLELIDNKELAFLR